MNMRRHALSIAMASVLAGVCGLPLSVFAQAVAGPGTINSTLTSTSGTTTVVGNTTISTGNADGVRANGGDVVLDMSSPLSAPGTISVLSNAYSLHATN